MKRKNNKFKKQEKEVEWFVHKYIWKEENLPLFVSKLSPHAVFQIFNLMLEKGMQFTWEDEDTDTATFSSPSLKAGVSEGAD